MEFRVPQVWMEFFGVDADDLGTALVNENLATVLSERLLTFEFSDHAEEIDELRLGFANDDRYLTDSGIFVVGNAFLVSWGWPGQLSEVRRMIVCKREQNTPYAVFLRDPMILLGQKKRPRQMKHVTDSEWVAKVAAEYGYKGSSARITPTKIRHDITQGGKRSDSMQITEMARKNGFISYIDQSGLYWWPRILAADPLRTFHYRTGSDLGTIIGEPVIEQFTDRAFAQVAVTARDPVKKKSFTIEVSSKDMLETALGQETEIGDPKDDGADSKRKKRAEKIEVRPMGYMTEEEATLLAKSVFRDNAQGMYQMKMKVMGDAWLEAKFLIELRGHSGAYDGLYYVREAVHHIEAGTYTIELSCERDALTEFGIAKKVRRKAPKAPPPPPTASPDAPDGADTQNPAATRVIGVAYGADGKPKVAYKFVVKGVTVGTAENLTEAQINALDDASIRRLGQQGAQTLLPEI